MIRILLDPQEHRWNVNDELTERIRRILRELRSDEDRRKSNDIHITRGLNGEVEKTEDLRNKNNQPLPEV
jgi:hypothetical protein